MTILDEVLQANPSVLNEFVIFVAHHFLWRNLRDIEATESSEHNFMQGVKFSVPLCDSKKANLVIPLNLVDHLAIIEERLCDSDHGEVNLKV
jgi:hypothetical protein